MALSSHASPMPTANVPDNTVTCSSLGCQCGGTRAPAGNWTRTVNAPWPAGSPESSAILTPAGRFGGPSFHVTFDGGTITCAEEIGVAESPLPKSSTTFQAPSTFFH